MVRRQKLISMTDHHFEFASEMPNFSKWVRERIEEYIENTQEDKYAMRWYKCPEGHEHMYNPKEDRIRGRHYPLDYPCKGSKGNRGDCDFWAVRQ